MITVLVCTAWLVVAQPAAPATATSQAASTAPAEIQPRAVRDLVDQLDADDLTDRLAAEAKLLEMGPRVLPLLPDPAKFQGQQQKSLAEIITKLQTFQAKAAISSQAFTLEAGLSLSAAIKQLSKASGNVITDARGEQPEAAKVQLSAAINEPSFWQAFDRLLDDGQLGVYPYGDDGPLSVVTRSPRALPRYGRASYQGAFRISADRILLERSIELDAAHGSVRLQVAWEPRIQPLFFLALGDSFQATDDLGQPIVYGAPRTNIELPVQSGEGVAELELPIQSPQRAAKSIQKLSGSLKAVVPAESLDFEFTDLAKRDQSQLKGDCTVVLESARRVDDADTVYEIRIRVGYKNAGPAFESHRNWIFNNPAKLLDAKGDEVELGLTESTLRAENEVGVAYFYDLPQGLAGHKFVYRTPIKIIESTVEYVLEDLPLP